MKKITQLLLVFVLLLTLSACTEQETLTSLGLNDLTGKEILVGVADGSIAIDGYSLSVYDDELVVIVEDERIGVDMPEDEFYISVAPYIDETHECLYHSATGCRGELKKVEFFVEFIDNDGTVYVSEYMTSLSNGFIDMWLPRNVEGTLTITYDGLEASKVISTSPGQPTCETTMKLQ